MSAIGTNIKFLREHHKFTTIAVAKKLNINVQDYNAWESGLLLPTIDNVMSICAIYRISNPTELFSDSFIQKYNAKELKSLKELALKKSQEEDSFNKSTKSKLNFVIPDGSYHSKPLFFDICLVFAFVLLIGFFLPCFSNDTSTFIGYLPFGYNIIVSVLVYVATILTITFIIFAFRLNYKIVSYNEYYPKNFASRLKLIYMVFPVILMILHTTIFVFGAKNYEVGLPIVMAVSICMFLSALVAISSIKPAKPDSITYSYVMKFSKYKIKSDAPRKWLKTLSIIGIVLAVTSVALIIVQLVVSGGIFGLMGVGSGFIKSFSDAFLSIWNNINSSIAVTIVMGLCGALFVYLQISDLVLCSQLKEQYQKGNARADDVYSTKKLIVINLILGIVTYVVVFAVILLGLVSSPDARINAAQYYVMPIMTLISVFVVCRLSVYIKSFFVYRGSETIEVTGYSEVLLDQQAEQTKIEKKNAKKQPKEKVVKEKKDDVSAEVEKPTKVVQTGTGLATNIQPKTDNVQTAAPTQTVVPTQPVASKQTVAPTTAGKTVVNQAQPISDPNKKGDDTSKGGQN